VFYAKFEVSTALLLRIQVFYVITLSGRNIVSSFSSVEVSWKNSWRAP